MIGRSERTRVSVPRGRRWSSAGRWPLFAVLALLIGVGDVSGAAEPPHVVILGGSLTEIAYALHREDRIVGVDTTSVFPPEALASKSSVGYVRALSAEGILSLKPTLVLAIEGAGPPDALKIIEASGTPFRSIPDEATPQGVARKIEAVGAALGAEADAQALKADVASRFAAVAALKAKVTKPLRVLFLLSLQNGRSMVGGRGTSADGIITLSGGINAADAIDGYKTMTDEGIAASAPDVVLVMQNGTHALSADTVFALPAYAATPAAATRRLLAMDGLLLLGFGPRTPDAAKALMRSLYPDDMAVAR